MKKLIRHYAIETYGLWAASQLASGIVFEDGIKTLVIAGGALTVASLVAKPVINLLLLPLNMITFNLFKWVSSGVVLYLVTLVISGFRVDKFAYAGFTSKWFDIPSLTFEGVLAYVGYALILSVVTGFIYWVVK